LTFGHMHLAGFASVLSEDWGLKKMCTYPVSQRVKNVVQKFGAWNLCALIRF
jgi:hypothetical protein